MVYLNWLIRHWAISGFQGILPTPFLSSQPARGQSWTSHTSPQIWRRVDRAEISSIKMVLRTSPAVQWLRFWASNAGGSGSVPGQEINSPCTVRCSQNYQINKCVCALSGPTLCDSMDGSPPGSSVHVIFQAKILEWAAISFSRGSSWPRNRTYVSCVSYSGRRILYHLSHQGSRSMLYTLFSINNQMREKLLGPLSSFLCYSSKWGDVITALVAQAQFIHWATCIFWATALCQALVVSM